ncbi:hypothetical protein [Sphingomonas sp. MA1305]|uniref:hypothetical protein n=1 Tax=Sphingomonas sp. MA1305 TaxID=2479204 RepID=UPI002FCD0F1F
MSFPRIAAAFALTGAVAAAAPALAAGPLTIATRMMVEKRIAAADGTTRIQMVPAVKAVPGARITVVLAYRNTGAQPIGNVVLANPVPRNIAYRNPAPGSAAPELSVDGSTYGPLSALTVAGPQGRRPATLDDVTHVRWRLSSPIAAGQGGELAFQAVLK